ncbi:hypothetical protein OQH61_08635 [Helicobacter sp. MIT 21-1697]|uniref:hypothetical protein n=1 Tax=Helicobacter sp. MIT 21-1697 TaxID=2993733 RepID=UPI00224A7572|nr:hypothetical protein [Helicobacter sp. MIT 21-1697]MCX2717796.1 hypothetical protein [Helicobacter sp. MIT 21-1697]
MEKYEINAFYLGFDSDNDRKREEVIDELINSGITYYQSEKDKTNGIITYPMPEYKQDIANEIKSIVKFKSTRFILIPLTETNLQLYSIKF